MRSLETAISNLRYAPASSRQRSEGLLGWVSFRLAGAFHIDGVALRRTRDGRLALSWPVRRDSRGRHHPLVRPLSDAVRINVERQVFARLREELAG